MVFSLQVTLIKEVNITRSGRLVITKLKASYSKKKKDGIDNNYAAQSSGESDSLNSKINYIL